MQRFSSYMNDWLYGDDGYYSSFKKIGKEGDFYTAVSATPFFGGAIAKRFLSLLNEGFLNKKSSIVEIGAHQGYLLADIIQFVYTFEPNLLESLNFVIVEPLENISNIQKKYFKDSFGNSLKVNFVKDLSEVNIESAFVVANELFDAFACEVVKNDKMLYRKENDFKFLDLVPEVQKIVSRYGIEKGEISLGFYEFAKKLSTHIKKFEFVTFDYGELEHRGEYSLRIYDKHKVYPFFSLTKYAEDKKLTKSGVSIEKLYKKSDITYDVFFRHLIDSFEEAGVANEAYMTQMKAMIDFGIVELLEILKEKKGEKAYINELNRVKTLMDPSFMGERFKCLIFRKS